MLHYLNLALSAVFAQNLLLVSAVAFGTNPKSFLYRREAWCTGLSLILVLCILLPVSRFCCEILELWGLDYYSLVLLSLIATLGTVWVGKLLKTISQDLWLLVEDSFLALPSNGAILASLILCNAEQYNYRESFVFAFFGGLGVLMSQVTLVELLGQEKRLSQIAIIRLLPKIFLTVGLLSVALLGFYGFHFS